MAFFKRMRVKFHDDWCEDCLEKMQRVKKQLFYMPQSVGHYIRHEDAAYYVKSLIPVEKKADIPTGMYACGMYVYRCMQCGVRYVKLTPFLPVRGEEKNELPLMFMKGELNELLESI